MNCHTVAYHTYKAGHQCARQVPSFLALTLKSLTLPFTGLLHCTHYSCTMAGESDQTLLTVGDATTDTKTISGAESDVAATSCSCNATIEKVVRKDIPVLTDYWKKSKVTEEDHVAYNTVG
jgi:hypothetical protein